jgi:hypothetical protein
MSTKTKKKRRVKTKKSAVLDVTWTEKYFKFRLDNPEYKKRKCARLAGFSDNTSIQDIEDTEAYKQLKEEYEARLQDVQRDTQTRINEAMAAYKCSAKELTRALADIVETSGDEKTKIAAVKQITDITQDKNKEQVDHNIPGMETALAHLFTDD